MSSTCVESLPCHDCGSPGGRQVYLNKDDDLGVEWYTSFCHSACWEQKGDPYTDGVEAPKVIVKTAHEIWQEVKTITTCPIFIPKKPYRSIPGEAYKSWKLRVLLSEYDGKTPYALGFPMSDDLSLSGFKIRPFRKKAFFGIGQTSNCDPFGLVRALRIPSRILWVTEGEFDAIALDYCLTKVTLKKQFPVISLTHGGGSIEKNFNQIADILDDYDEIRLVLDDDEVGHKAESTAIRMYGNKIKLISKPVGCKDANDAVENGKTTEMGKLALLEL